MAPRKLKPGDLYDGPKGIATVDGVTAFYALNDKGEPVAQLVQVDLAPGEPDNHSEEFRVAGKDDPAQRPAPPPGGTVELEPEGVFGSSSTEV